MITMSANDLEILKLDVRMLNDIRDTYLDIGLGAVSDAAGNPILRSAAPLQVGLYLWLLMCYLGH